MSPDSPAAAGVAPAPLLGAVALLAFGAAVHASAVTGFAMGRAVSAADLLAGVAAMAIVCALGSARSTAGAVRAAALLGGCVAVLAASGLLALLRFDTSPDGQGYHQQAVIALARGWNPVLDPGAHLGFWAEEYIGQSAKGAWTVGAAVYRLCGRLEAAKLLALALPATAGLAAFSALRAAGLARVAAAVGALLAAWTPISSVQAFTFYVDGQLASALTAFAAFAFLAVTARSRWALVGLVAATVVLVEVKLTGVPYAVVLWIATAAATAVRDGAGRAARVALLGAATIAVAVGGLGWSPYVTNTLREGHPFHPAAGPRKLDIAATDRPAKFARMNRVERLARSVFSASAADVSDGGRLKAPFTIVGDEATKFHQPDVRLGGFGPLFSGALLLSAAAAPFAARRNAAVAGAIAAALLASALVTDEAWWARFAPQLWLVPLCLALAPLAAPRRRGALIAAGLALAALAADDALVWVNNINRNRHVQRELRAQLARLAAAPAPVPVRLGLNEAAAVRLDEAGVRWRAVASLPCPERRRLVGTYTAEVCEPATP
jgi:hypothetical protein